MTIINDTINFKKLSLATEKGDGKKVTPAELFLSGGWQKALLGDLSKGGGPLPRATQKEAPAPNGAPLQHTNNPPPGAKALDLMRNSARFLPIGNPAGSQGGRTSGIDLLGGKLPHALRPTPKPNDPPDPPKPPSNEFGPHQERPQGDYRSAAEILAESPLLKNLGDQSAGEGLGSIREELKKRCGDYENDPDAAYRAVQVLNHIERYDSDGHEVHPFPGSGNDPGNGTINGYTSSGEAVHGTEAGRLQDFLKQGYGSLKGGEIDAPPPPPPPPPPPLPIEGAVRPAGDHRTAEEIINANPALKNLGNQEGVREMLKQRCGDFEHDADAAYRASQVIDYITHTNEKGQPITEASDGNDPNNTRIDGFSMDHGIEVALNGTEAGRLKDFGKFGYASLKGRDGKNPSEKIDSLQANGLRDAVTAAHGDPSKLGSEYWTTGKTDARPQDKVAALIKLTEGLANYRAGRQSFIGSQDLSPNGAAHDKGRDEFEKDIQSKIDKLKADPDVQKFVAEEGPKAIQKRVADDPELKAELQRRLEVATSPAALTAQLGKKDKDGKPVSMSEAVLAFVKEAEFYGQALNQKPDLKKAFADAPPAVKEKLLAEYKTLTSGEFIRNSKESPEKAIAQAAAYKAAFDGILDDATVQQGTSDFNKVASEMGRASLMDGTSIEEILKGLNVKDMNDAELAKVIEKNINKLVPPGEPKPPTADIIALLRAFVDVPRGAMKFDDKMAKAIEAWSAKLPKGVSETYKSGIVHAASGVLQAGALAARMASGQQTPADYVETAFSAAGLLSDSMTKGLTFGLDKFKNYLEGKDLAGRVVIRLTQAEITSLVGKLSKFEGSAGAGLGFVGNVLGAVTGFISVAGDKNPVTQGFNSVLASLNALSAIAGGVEIASVLAPQLVGATVGRIAGAASGALAVITAFVTLITSIVSLSSAIDKHEKEVSDWFNQVSDEFGAVGIHLLDYDTPLALKNNAPDQGDPPVMG